jgi:hypothetical protein
MIILLSFIMAYFGKNCQTRMADRAAPREAALKIRRL